MEKPSILESPLYPTVFFFTLTCLLCIALIAVVSVQRYGCNTYTGEVITVTQQSLPFKVTIVELKTYSGSSVRVAHDGWEDYTIGSTVKISTVGRWGYLYPVRVSVEVIG